ncbi:MAG: prepilin peptidase [Chloroflexota bacterium]|nr:prepilin peptidase [Chloroflexota bacterium]PLS78496.1 MAG: prepilin peptidase [Chloroflexota bacterium]
MIGLVLLLGAVLGTALNLLIAAQLRGDLPQPEGGSPLRWVPLVGSLARRAWVGLAVELATIGMAVVLWQQHGWTPRFWLLLAASLVLIDTAAIDWQVKLIDTLIMVAATVGAVAFAPMIVGSWTRSLQGLLAAGLVFVLFFVIAKMLYPHQQAPFGLGDVYLGMFIGALVGFYNVGPALFYGMMLAGLASIGMIVVLGFARARHIPISYGSFLCLGVLLYLVVSPL